ncbi:putative methylase domain protein [Mycobacterium ulcerans str. Harvey]|uniref:Methylase domain protein n=1 Tax=Mycobacterium ulcerans str. Harvey TaxID=1299332 RepID=A0ABP3AR56_MYCUL|nr:putative methylase domain protein [Mycobacterium ulcerans str. Harvey]
MWCYATDEMRAWWGGMWADRILRSDLSAQLLGSGMASAQIWRRFRRLGATGPRHRMVAGDSQREILCRV